MNSKKGFYTAIIGLLAIMLISTTLILVRGNQQFERNYGTTKAFPDLKAQLQNSQYILDITTTDALSDLVNQNSCEFPNAPEIKTKIIQYFDDSLSEMYGSNCKIENPNNLIVEKTNSLIEIQPTQAVGGITQTFDINDFDVSFTLLCKMESKKNNEKESSISYSRKVKYRKKVVLDKTSGSGCDFTIIDNQSGFIEKISNPKNPLIPGAKVIEVESGAITAPMNARFDDTTASGGGYVYSTDNDNGTAVYNNLVIPGPANREFFICGRAVSIKPGQSTFSIKLEGAVDGLNGCTTVECRTWDVLQAGIDTGYSTPGPSNDWKWDTVNIRGTTEQPYAVNPLVIKNTALNPSVKLTIEGAEGGTKLDKLMIVPKKYSCPTQFSYYQ